MTDRTIQSVLQIHTRYRQAGGEDQVVAAERGLLEDAGVRVHQVIFDNSDVAHGALPARASSAFSTIWSRSAAGRVRQAIVEYRPDVVHVHNTFVAASPSVIRVAWGTGRPVVQTLHNYRLFCIAGTAFRGGRPCVDCLGRAPLPGVLHRCYRHSTSGSMVVAATLAVHRAARTFDRFVDAYVALTAYQRDLLADAGLPSDRIHVVPNFVSPLPMGPAAPRAGFVYLGRLATEKGIGTLLEAARHRRGVIRIAGAGPLDGAVTEAASDGLVVRLGSLSRLEADAELRSAVALVVPSLWFEGFPMAVLEAFAAGTPVIASRIGSLAQIVEDGRTGLLVDPGDAPSLAERIGWAEHHPGEMRRMGEAARARFDASYSAPAHLDALLAVYDAARRRRTGAAGVSR